MDSTGTVRAFLALKGQDGATFTEVVEGLKKDFSKRTIWLDLERLRGSGGARREPQQGGRGKPGRWYYVPPNEAAQSVRDRRTAMRLRGLTVQALPPRDADPKLQAKRLAGVLRSLLRVREEVLLTALDGLFSRDSLKLQKEVLELQNEGLYLKWVLSMIDTFQKALGSMEWMWDESMVLALIMRPEAAREALKLLGSRGNAEA